jgi:hypothetical protein
LEKLVREVKRPEERDRVWVEVQESLGDFHWTRRNQQNWGAAWPYYQAALEWWAGARDLELARERYLALVGRMAKPPGVQREYHYGSWGNYVPLEVLDNTLKIARSANDQAHAHFLIAMTVRNQGGDWERRARVPEEFEAALKPGRTTDWYDDACTMRVDGRPGTRQPAGGRQRAAGAGLSEGARTVSPARDGVRQGRDALLGAGPATNQEHHRATTRRECRQHFPARLGDSIRPELAERETN